MTALVLAAGIGRRLWPLTAEIPKCLLPVGGSCLLDRLVSALEIAQIDRVVCVVGYLRGRLVQALEALQPSFEVRYVVNHRYELGSIVSLHAALGAVDDDVLILDADVLFPRELLASLAESALPNAFLLDASSRPSGEEMILTAASGGVTDIHRGIRRSDWDKVGESMGFLKLDRSAARSLRESVDDLVQRSPHYGDYEEAYVPVLAKHRVGYLEITGTPWIEVDTSEDLRAARQLVLPRVLDWERQSLRTERR